MIYYRGISEYKTGKTADAEKSFNQVVKLNPKDSLSLFYLAQIALGKNDLDGAIANLNRATVNDARLTGAWTLLTSAYLRRAATSTDPAKADADYLSAVRAGEGLIKLRTDAEAVTLFGQALIGSKQYARAAAGARARDNWHRMRLASRSIFWVWPIRAQQFPEGDRGARSCREENAGRREYLSRARLCV
jgi:predicted Zn-dependent protease